MIAIGGRRYKEVWIVDFEFIAPAGECPDVVCMVAHEVGTGRTLCLWGDELKCMERPPFTTDGTCLYVAYYASAEMGCHLALGWPLPTNLLDLYPEFRVATNGRSVPCGSGLLGALAWYGLDSIAAQEKSDMRDLIMRGGPWTEGERRAILDYCETDVIATTRLLGAMHKQLDIDRALLRGRYMKAAARIEYNGTPVDTDTLAALRVRWADIQDKLIQRIDSDYGVYDGRTFKIERWAQWLKKKNIPWPILSSGRLDLKENTFKEMARSYPEIAPIRELRGALSQMRLTDLSVGKDARNRCLLSVFRAKTGRNQPSNSRFVFGPSVWMRSLIKPRPGFGLAYIDWSQQEFGIAAALSRDPMMMEAYRSGDPYLAFAKQVGAVPGDATKATHGSTREQFKACVLAVQYGMGAESLAYRINQPVARARELLHVHRETYRVFWRWSDSVVNHAMLKNELWTVFGWRLHTGQNANERSLRNFPMQANGAEMLRLACCFVTELGIKVCAPIHDAILIEARLDGLDDAIATTQGLMEKASVIVLNDFSLRSDAKVIRYPERYVDERGEKMWDTVWGLLHDKAAA